MAIEIKLDINQLVESLSKIGWLQQLGSVLEDKITTYRFISSLKMMKKIHDLTNKPARDADHVK